MYKVIFKKQIHAGFSAAQSDDVYLVIEKELPFVPTTDVSYTFGDIEIESNEWLRACNQNGYSVNDLNYIYWDGGTFTYYVPPDKELYNAELNEEDGRPIEEIVKEYTELGWSVCAD